MNHLINSYSHNHTYFTLHQHIHTQGINLSKSRKFVSRLNEYYLKRIDFSEAHANIPYHSGWSSIIIKLVTAQNAHIQPKFLRYLTEYDRKHICLRVLTRTYQLA